jgi:O-antigen/teichoic acid export membrane protein
MIRSLFKRSATHFSGLIFGQAISTVVFIFLARVLLPEKFGQLILATTLVQVVTILGDMGLKQWYQKHAFLFNKSKTFAKTIFTRMLTLFFSIITLGAGLYFFNWFDFVSSAIVLLILIPQALLSLAEAYHLEEKHAFKVGMKSVSSMLAFISIYWLLGFPTVLMEVLGAWLLGLLLTTLWFFPWEHLSYLKKFTPKDAFYNLKESSAYAVLTITSLFYSKGDSLIIARLKGTVSLGFYGGAYRFLETISLLPGAINQNLFPIAAKKGNVSKQQLYKMVSTMASVGLVLAFLLYSSTNFIIYEILGREYLAALPVLRIFSLVVIMFFINSPMATIVQSSDMVKKFLPFGILNTILNLALNIVLVSRFGFVYAAWVMLFTEFTGFLINLYFVRKIYAR